MWRLLGDLAYAYCAAASWATAAGDQSLAAELVEKARACLFQRGLCKPGPDVGLRDVIRSD